MTGTSKALYEMDVRRMADEATACILVGADDEGRIVYANQKAEKMFGYVFGEMETLCVEKLMPERFRVKHVELRRSYVADQAIRPAGCGVRAMGLHKNGTEFPVVAALTTGFPSGKQFVLVMIWELPDISKHATSA